MVELPTIQLRPVEDASLDALDESDWLALTSPSGAEIFFDLLRRQRRDPPGHTKMLLPSGYLQ